VLKMKQLSQSTKLGKDQKSPIIRIVHFEFI